MKLKDRIKTYNFWVSLASAILLIVNTLGKQLNFSIDENLYNDLFTSFCGILVLLGIIVPPSNPKKSDLMELEREFEDINKINKDIDIEKLNSNFDINCEEQEDLQKENNNFNLQNSEHNSYCDKSDTTNIKNISENIKNDDNYN